MFLISCCTPMLMLLVNGVLKLRSISVGNSCAGIAACDSAPNGPQKKKPGALPTAAAAGSLKQILIGRQPRQRLNVAEIDHRVRRNKRMTRRYDAIESIDADEQTRRKRTSDVARRDLC